jgi:hypothetical protein
MSYGDTSPRPVRTSSEFEVPGLISLRSVRSSRLEIDVRVRAREFVGDPGLVVDGPIADGERDIVRTK